MSPEEVFEGGGLELRFRWPGAKIPKINGIKKKEKPSNLISRADQEVCLLDTSHLFAESFFHSKS